MSLSVFLSARLLARAGWSPRRLRSLVDDGSASQLTVLRVIVWFPLGLSAGLGLVLYLALPPPFGSDMLWLCGLQGPALLVASTTLLRARSLGYRFSGGARLALCVCAVCVGSAQLMLSLTPAAGSAHDAGVWRSASAAMLALNMAPLVLLGRLLAPAAWHPQLKGDDDKGGMPTTGPPPVPHPSPLVSSLLCACVYLLTLAAYAASGPYLAPLAPAAAPLAAVAVLLLDVLVWLQRRAGLLPSVGSQLCLCLGTRVVLVACGEDAGVMGESLLLCLHGAALTRHIVRARHPPPPSPLKRYAAGLVVQRQAREHGGGKQGIGGAAGGGGGEEGGNGGEKGGYGGEERDNGGARGVNGTEDGGTARLPSSRARAELALAWLCGGHLLALALLSLFHPPALRVLGCELSPTAAATLAPLGLVALATQDWIRSAWRGRGARVDDPQMLRMGGVWAVGLVGGAGVAVGLIGCSPLLPALGLLPLFLATAAALHDAWRADGYVAMQGGALPRMLQWEGGGYARLGEPRLPVQATGAQGSPSSGAGRASTALASAARASAAGGVALVRAAAAAREASPRDVTAVLWVSVLAAEAVALGVAIGMAGGGAAAGVAAAGGAGMGVTGCAALLSAHHRPADGAPVAALVGAFALLHVGACVWLGLLMHPSLPALVAAALAPPLCLDVALLAEYSDDAPAGTPPSRRMLAAAAATATAAAVMVCAIAVASSLLTAGIAAAAAALALVAAAERAQALSAPALRRAVAVAVGSAVAVGLLAGAFGYGAVSVVGVSLACLAAGGAMAYGSVVASRPRHAETWRHRRAGRWGLPLPSAVCLAGGEVLPDSRPAELAVGAATVVAVWACYATLCLPLLRPAGVGVEWGAALLLLDAAAACGSKAALAVGSVAHLLTEEEVAEARKAAVEASVDGHREAPAAAVAGQGKVAAERGGGLEGRGDGWLAEREAGAARSLWEAEDAWATARRVDRPAAWHRVGQAEAALAAMHWERVAAEARLVSALLGAAKTTAEAERRELMLFLSEEVGGGGGAGLEAQWEGLDSEEKEALDGLSSSFREARTRRARLDAIRTEEEKMATEARRELLRERERRAVALRAAVERGRASTRSLRRRVRDAAGECALRRVDIATTGEALRRMGGKPAAVPEQTVDATGAAEREEAAEAAEMGAVAAAAAAISAEDAPGTEAGAEAAGADAEAEARRRGLSGPTAAALVEEARLRAQLDAQRRSVAGAEADRHAELVERVRRWFEQAEAELGAAANAAAAHAAALAELAAAEGRAVAAAASRLDSAAAEVAAAEAKARERAAAERERREADARLARQAEEAREAADAEARLRGDDPLRCLVLPVVRASKLSGVQWEDAEFPATDAVLPPSARGAAWRRARQLCRAPTIFSRGSTGADSIDPSDISQGALGTCYLLSALSVAAARPELIRSCFVTTEPNEAGVYCIRFFRDGKPKHVLVDDRFPAHHAGTPLFAASKQKDELWVAILEKVWTQPATPPPCGDSHAAARSARPAVTQAGLALLALLCAIVASPVRASPPLWPARLSAPRFPAPPCSRSSAPHPHPHPPRPQAYAKLFGTYTAIEGGFVDEALVDITGGVGGDNIPLAGADLDVLWRKLLTYSRAGYLLGAGSPAGADTDVSAEGIVQGHAYSCLRVVEEGEHRLVQLRNPWGRGEWKGEWSDGSATWTARLKARLGWTDEDDGVFWMCLRDFCGHFASLYVCKLPSPLWARAEIEGEWRGPTAGGCPNFDTVGDNPQWRLVIGSEPTACLLCLAQADARGADLDGDGVLDEPFPIGLAVVFKQGGRVRKLYASDWCRRTSPFRNVREVSIDVTLEPRDGAAATTYTLLPSTFQPGQERAFRIRVFSEKPVKIELIPP